MPTIETQIVKLFKNTKIDNVYYSEVFGFSENVPTYRNITHLYAKIFFSILNKFRLDYYVFAGTSIGFVRDKKNIPWVDDYDIIVFNRYKSKFEATIIPYLKTYGFTCKLPGPKRKNAGWQVYSKFGSICFQCDIFYTKITNDGTIKNMNKWGRYNSKNVPLNVVRPKRYLTIDDDLTLPFFNNMNKDISLEYGDVINTSVFHINHAATAKFNLPFKRVYAAFNNVKQQIINNLKTGFDKHKYTTNMTLHNFNALASTFETKNLAEMSIKFLKYIDTNNVKNLYICNEEFLKFVPDIQFYFPHIQIHFYMLNELKIENVIFLNYITDVFIAKNINIKSLDKYDMILLTKPKIHRIKVITFGTFDLFHVGHENILTRASTYGELVVGVSTDILNKEKGKTSINNIEKRKADVINMKVSNQVFNEESLELKNTYVKNNSCNLLIMGDDWKDGFNFCDCACLYLPRTPNISTTVLKNAMNTCEGSNH